MVVSLLNCDNAHWGGRRSTKNMVNINHVPPESQRDTADPELRAPVFYSLVNHGRWTESPLGQWTRTLYDRLTAAYGPQGGPSKTYPFSSLYGVGMVMRLRNDAETRERVRCWIISQPRFELEALAEYTFRRKWAELCAHLVAPADHPISFQRLLEQLDALKCAGSVLGLVDGRWQLECQKLVEIAAEKLRQWQKELRAEKWQARYVDYCRVIAWHHNCWWAELVVEASASHLCL